jgi:NAD(P)-dependent dehydrogenase (short-subunit alcohol dehydrogenase family)
VPGSSPAAGDGVAGGGADRLLVAGASSAEVGRLAAMGLGGRVSTLQPGPGGWELGGDHLSAPCSGVEDGVGQWLEEPGGAVVVAPSAPAATEPSITPPLAVATASTLLARNLTVGRDAARAVARSESATLGRLVLVTWSFDRDAMAAQPLLAAVAGAVGQLGRALAAELGPRGVTVNTVAPSWGRQSEAEDLLAMALDPDCGYLTGEVLTPSRRT